MLILKKVLLYFGVFGLIVVTIALLLLDKIKFANFLANKSFIFDIPRLKKLIRNCTFITIICMISFLLSYLI